MNKVQILEKAKKRKTTDFDEREIQIMLKAYRLASITSLFACIILMLIKMNINQTYYDVYGISAIIIGCQNLYFGIKTHNKSYIFAGWSLISIFIIITYIIDVIG